MSKKYQLIIFDADGTLTPQRGSAIGDFSFTLLPGVAAKCAELRAQGVMLAIASNQSSRRPLDEIADQLFWTADQLSIERRLINYACDRHRQKPAPAMLDDLRDWTLTPEEKILFVGDQPTDEAAAQAAGIDFAWAADFFKP